MPAYISHAIMGEEIHNRLIKEDMLQIYISKEELKGYSLGADLAYLSKRITSDPHNSHTKDFFISIIKYIKENNLIENDHIMALLYGHISHYFLDTNIHPLIYYIEYGCQKVGIISNHNLIEGYLSSYLSEKVLNKKISEIKPNYFNKINLSDKQVSDLLNQIYGEIYGDYHILKTYKKTLFIFSMIEHITKNKLISKELLILFSCFNQFLEKNNLTLDDLTNENHQIFTNPVTGEKYNDSFLELYNKAIKLSLEAIDEVNNYLYLDSSIQKLDTVFQDLSYDTGVSCQKGRKFVYTRK